MTALDVNIGRDKYLTEAMGGIKVFCCTVDCLPGDLDQTCQLFGVDDYSCSVAAKMSKDSKPEDCIHWEQHFVDGVTDFSTWTNFGILWEWAQEQGWFDMDFLYHNCIDGGCVCRDDFVRHAVHPDRFANAVYKFLKSRESEES